MPFLNFNSASSALKLVITLMTVLTIGIIVWFFGFLLFRLIFGIEIPDANNILHGDTSILTINHLKYNLLIQTLGFFVIPGIFLQWLFSTKEQSYFEIRKRPSNISKLLVFFTLLASIPFVNFLIEYNSTLPFPSFLHNLESRLHSAQNATESIMQQILSVNTFGGYLYNVLLIAILPAIGEELIFRGVFQKMFTNLTKNKHMAVVMAAILFSAFHGEFFSFIPRFALGLFFGYLMLWSNTIWLPVFAHFINNLIAVSMYYLANIGYISLSPEKMEGGIFQIWGILISAVLCFAGLALIKRKELGQAITQS